MRCLRSLVSTEIKLSPAQLYLRLESLPGRTHTEQSGLVVNPCCALILGIGLMHNYSQIAPSVVSGYRVPVVYLARWPFSGHVEPSQSVCLIISVI